MEYESRTRKLIKENPQAFQDYYQDYETTFKDKIARQKDILTGGRKDTAMFQEDIAGPGGCQDDLLKSQLRKKGLNYRYQEVGCTVRDSDVTDWEKFAEGLYDKKSSRGEAQLGLAGNVLAAAFQPKKEAMAILGKGLGDFGKTATQRKKKMEDIAATGKMYDNNL